MATPPLYTVTLTGVTGPAWTVTATHKVAPAPSDPLVLLDDFSYGVGFADGQVPGTREPAQATIRIGAATVAGLPAVAAGHLVRLTVRAGDPTAPTLVDSVFRTADPTVDMHPGSRIAGRMTLTLTDLLADLPGRVPDDPLLVEGQPGYTTPHPGWYGRLMQLGYVLNVWVGIPTTWPTELGGASPLVRLWIAPDEWENRTAAELFNELARSAAVNREIRTLVPRYSLTPPAGYEHRTPTGDYDYVNYDAGTSGVQLLMVPAGRLAAQPMGLPDRLYKFGSDPWTIRPVAELATPSYMKRMALIDACWIEAPAAFTRSRAHAVNLLQVKGKKVRLADGLNAYDDKTVERTRPGTRPRELTLTDGGPRGRLIETNAITRVSNQDAWSDVVYADVRNQLAALAEAYLPDQMDPASAHGFDSFTVLPEAIPTAMLPVLLPRLFPRVPGDGGDDVLARPFVIYGVAADSLPTGIGGRPARPEGYITRTEVRIQRGKFRIAIDTTPGAPRVQAGSGAITWSNLTVGGPTWASPMDPAMTWARFAWVRYPAVV